MPPIVFMIDRQYVYAPGNGIFFFDNQGNLYFTNNPTVYELIYLELCEAFAEGELDDVIIHKGTCSQEEIYENYKLLKEVSLNEQFVLWPREEPIITDNFTDTWYWVGVYYDEEERLSVKELQREKNSLILYGSDDKAIQICEWIDKVARDVKEVREDRLAEVSDSDDKMASETLVQLYFKSTTAENVLADEATGIAYVKNQVLVSAYPEVHKSIISQQAQKIGAEVVGYVELTNNYQLEFTEDKTLGELNEMKENLLFNGHGLNIERGNMG